MGRSILHPSHISRSAAAMKAQSKSKRPRVQGGYFEALESRTLLTAVFTPVFGVETTSSGPDEHMTQPPIYLILWGSYWGGTNTPQSQAIIDAANKVITSPFPHIVDQYGADGSNMVIAQTVWDSSDPSSGNFDSGNIDDVVQNQIDNGPFPEAQDATNNPIYVVVTPPKVMSNDPKAAGFNIVQSDFDLPLDFDDVPEAWSWTGRNGDGSLNVDAFSLTFSHEVAEIMSDYDQEGYQINAGANWFGGGDNQIGDKEGNFYSFRMSNGVDVQPVWSRADNAWAVNDGTTQKFNFLPNWSGQNFNFNYALTLNGDQLGPNDDVTVGSTPAGGVTVTLNGEVMNFDKNYLSGITIDTGIGLNTVHVNPLPANVTLSITSTGGFVTLDGPNTANAWNITGANAGTLNGYSFNRVTDLVGGSASDTFTFQPGGTLGGTADGGGGTNSITGPDTDNFWSLTGADSGGLDLHASFKNVQNIQGGNSGDIFDFEGSGFISGNINGAGFGPDRNTLSFANFLSPVSVNLQSKTASRIGGTFSIINQVIGSVLPDTLTGPASATWTIDSANGGSVGGTQFTSFENLVGNSFTDSFVFMPGGSITGNLDGGLGTNTLDYHNLAGPITVNLGTGTGPGIGGTFSNITSVVGSASLNDTIVGPDASWVINGANSGTVNGIGFSSFENLTGPAGDDNFAFFPGGSVSGNIDGGAGPGINTLDYSNLSTPVSLNLANNTATGIGGAFSNIGGFVGGSGPNNVVGPEAPTNYVIQGHNKVSFGGFSFNNFQNITAGSFNDTFTFLAGGSLDGKIDGGGGINSLTYAAFVGDVVVNLKLNTATAAAGGIFNVRNVTGSIGNSLIVGDAFDNVLKGGIGRNILIGGAGADTVIGGVSDNILIGDSTIYDFNAVGLAAIFKEWNRTDLSFEQRVAHLISAGSNTGYNSVYNFNKPSIISDTSADSLVGTGGFDWFFETKKQDGATGVTPRDHVTQV